MNLVTVASHTVDLERLRNAPVILDVGCRGFAFVREFQTYFDSYGDDDPHFIAMDPDPAIEDPHITGCRFIRAGLIGDEDGESCFRDYVSFSTGEANYFSKTGPDTDPPGSTRVCLQLMKLSPVSWFDVVKLDCEGSEFSILENWPGPIADQISVEFHDWTDPKKRDGDYYEKLFAGPLKDYEVVQHELSVQGTGTGHWDTLLVLKGNA